LKNPKAKSPLEETQKSFSQTHSLEPSGISEATTEKNNDTTNIQGSKSDPSKIVYLFSILDDNGNEIRSGNQAQGIKVLESHTPKLAGPIGDFKPRKESETREI